MYQCSKWHPVIGYFPDISPLSPDKIVFDWTNCLIDLRINKNKYSTLAARLVGYIYIS